MTPSLAPPDDPLMAQVAAALLVALAAVAAALLPSIVAADGGGSGSAAEDGGAPLEHWQYDRDVARLTWRARSGETSSAVPRGGCLASNSTLLAERVDHEARIFLEAHDWSSHMMINSVASLLLEEAVGHEVDVLAVPTQGSGAGMYQRLSAGFVHANMEHWYLSSQGNYDFYTSHGLVDDYGPIGYDGRSGWYVTTTTLHKRADFAYWSFFKSLQDPLALQTLVPETWALLATDAGDEDLLRGITDPDTGEFVCQVDAERVAAGQEPAGCVGGVYAPPQCAGAHGGGGPRGDGTGPCAVLLSPTPDFDTGLLQQQTRNLNLNVSIAYLSVSRFTSTVGERVMDPSAPAVLLYWWEPDPFIVANRCSDATDDDFPCFTRIALPESSPECHGKTTRAPDGGVDCDFSAMALRTMAYAGLAELAPSASAFLRNMDVRKSDINDLMLAFNTNGGDARLAACEWVHANEERVLEWLPPAPECTLDKVAMHLSECSASSTITVTFDWIPRRGCMGGVELPATTSIPCPYVPLSSTPVIVALVVDVACAVVLVLAGLAVYRYRRTLVIRRAQPALLIGIVCSGLIACAAPLVTGGDTAAHGLCPVPLSCVVTFTSLTAWFTAFKSRRMLVRAQGRIDRFTDGQYLAAAIVLTVLPLISLTGIELAADTPTASRRYWLSSGTSVEFNVCSLPDAAVTHARVHMVLMVLVALVAMLRLGLGLPARRRQYNSGEPDALLCGYSILWVPQAIFVVMFLVNPQRFLELRSDVPLDSDDSLGGLALTFVVPATVPAVSHVAFVLVLVWRRLFLAYAKPGSVRSLGRHMGSGGDDGAATDAGGLEGTKAPRVRTTTFDASTEDGALPSAVDESILGPFSEAGRSRGGSGGKGPGPVEKADGHTPKHFAEVSDVSEVLANPVLRQYFSEFLDAQFAGESLGLWVAVQGLHARVGSRLRRAADTVVDDDRILQLDSRAASVDVFASEPADSVPPPPGPPGRLDAAAPSAASAASADADADGARVRGEGGSGGGGDATDDAQAPGGSDRVRSSAADLAGIVEERAREAAVDALQEVRRGAVIIYRRYISQSGEDAANVSGVISDEFVLRLGGEATGAGHSPNPAVRVRMPVVAAGASSSHRPQVAPALPAAHPSVSSPTGRTAALRTLAENNDSSARSFDLSVRAPALVDGAVAPAAPPSGDAKAEPHRGRDAALRITGADADADPWAALLAWEGLLMETAAEQETLMGTNFVDRFMHSQEALQADGVLGWLEAYTEMSAPLQVAVRSLMTTDIVGAGGGSDHGTVRRIPRRRSAASSADDADTHDRGFGGSDAGDLEDGGGIGHSVSRRARGRAPWPAASHWRGEASFHLRHRRAMSHDAR